MERILKITLDLMKGPSYDLGTLFTQKDVQSHYLQLEFKDKNLDFTNKKLKVNFIKANNTIVFTNIDHIENVNKILIPANALDVVGELQIEFVIYSSVDNFVLTSNKIVKVRVVQTSHGRDLDNIPGEEILEEFQEAMKKFLLGALPDNSIPASKLKTSTNADKIQMINLSDEVKQAMSGKAPVTPSLSKGSVVREYIADGAVDRTKLDDSIYATLYNIDKTQAFNFIELKNPNKETVLTNELLEISYLSDVEKKYAIQVLGGAGIPQSVEFNYSINKVGNLFQHKFTSKTPLNITITAVNIGELSGVTVTIKGIFANFRIKKSGGELHFTLKKEEGIVEEYFTGYSVSYDLMLKEIYNRKIGLNDFSNEDKLIALGKTEDKYSKIVEYTKPGTYFSGCFPILNMKLKAGKYKFDKGTDTIFSRILVFDSASGGKILQTFDMTKTNNEFILEEENYIGIISTNNDFTQVGTNFWYGSAGISYDFVLLETPNKMPTKGEILSTKYTSQYTTFTANFNLQFTPIYSLTSKELESKFEINVKEQKRKLAIASYRDIKTEPLEIVFRKSPQEILKDTRFTTTNFNNEIMRGFSNINFPYYSVNDTWKYKAKFKLNNLQSVVGISTINGEFESKSLLLDIENKQLVFGDAINSAIMTLEEKIELERVNPFTVNTPIPIENIDFLVGHFYGIVLERNGLEMTVRLFDYTSGKEFETKNNGARFHGGLSFLVQKGEILLKQIELRTALFMGAKAGFFGDSITEGLGMRDYDVHKSYSSLIRDKYFNGNAIICGRGWGTTSSVLETIKYLDYYNESLEYYFVMIGTNQRSASGVETWKKEIVEIYNKIIERNGIPVIITPPLGKEGNEFIHQMRDFILEKGWDTIRMDLAVSVNGEGQVLDEFLSTDGTHFNANGNQKMYERALIDLKKIM